MDMPISRRTFLGTSAAALAAALVPSRAARAMVGAGPHPTPRVGITAAKVATKEQLKGYKTDIHELFDAVRDIPEVVDGIRCQCGCANSEGFYSLLSCYEGDKPMARYCPTCQGEGRLAARLHKEGKSLDDIRSAIDAKFG
jgi:hypothetical protein